MNRLHTSLATACLFSIAALGAGCSAAATATTTPDVAGQSAPMNAAPQQPNQDQGGGGGGAPGVSGLIAEVTDQTMQVQGQDGQTAVTWTDATTFTAQVAGTASDVVVGSCVVAIGDSEDAVTRVTVTQAEDGACSMGGMRGGGGQAPDGQTPPSGRPTGMPSGMPSGGPTGVPSGMPSGGPQGLGAMTAGLVTAVDGSTVTVTQTAPGSTEETTSSFTLSADATVTATAAATSADAIVGSCASARGETDSTGALTATSVSLSQATDGQCGGGFR